jgi:hypothetical protein
MTNPVSDNQIFHDRDAVWFYRIEFGILTLVLLIVASQREWLLVLIPLLGGLGFLVAGPPISAQVSADGQSVLFNGPLRSTGVSSETLATVKGAGVNDYRAHLVLRNKHGLPIMYRCRKYENAAQLAQAVLDLIEKSPTVNVTDDGIKLLKKTAKIKARPITV